MAAPNAPPQFDPLNFPNFTADTLQSGISHLIYGMAIYEAATSVQLLGSVFTPSRMRSPIFFMTAASVFSLAGSLFFLLMLSFNVTSEDPFMGPAEFGANCAFLGLMFLGKICYFIAGTLRSRALLIKFPKTLYCLYFALFVIVVLDISAFALITAFLQYQRSTPPQFYAPDYPFNVPVYKACSTVQTITVTVEMLVANILMLSFLYPIYATINLELPAALKEMISLKDVQKAVYAVLLLFLYVGMFTAKPTSYLNSSTLFLWLNTQNSQFLRLSYVSTAELISKHRIGTSSAKPSHVGSIQTTRMMNENHA